MKIIELLNKIANGEEVPEKFKYDDLIFQRQGNYNYFDEDGDKLYKSIFSDFSNLNDEVVILDEPKEGKIKKVDTYVLCDSDFHRKCDDGYNLCATEIIDKAFEEYSYKINELIDELNKLKEK